MCVDCGQWRVEFISMLATCVVKVKFSGTSQMTALTFHEPGVFSEDAHVL